MVDLNKLREKIIQELRKVHDPEIPINVWDLGLIYELKTDNEGNVKIRMTLTAPGCPVAYLIVEQVKDVISRVEGVKNVDVELVWDPPWTPKRMTPEGREMFKTIFGYDIVEYWEQHYNK